MDRKYKNERHRRHEEEWGHHIAHRRVQNVIAHEQNEFLSGCESIVSLNDKLTGQSLLICWYLLPAAKSNGPIFHL